MKIFATEEEADQLYIKRIELTANDTAILLGLTVQGVYQLEKDGIIRRTKSGNFNLCETVQDYTEYERTGEKLPKTEDTAEAGVLTPLDDLSLLSQSQLATVMGLSPHRVSQLTEAGVFVPANEEEFIEDLVRRCSPTIIEDFSEKYKDGKPLTDEHRAELEDFVKECLREGLKKELGLENHFELLEQLWTHQTTEE